MPELVADQIIVRLNDLGDVEGVEHNRADSRLTVVSLVEAACLVLSHEIQAARSELDCDTARELYIVALQGVKLLVESVEPE